MKALRKRTLKRLLVALTCVAFILFQAPARARDIGFTEDPLKIGIGARPMGMARAFIAVADDGNALFTNPAGLSGQKEWSLTSMYSSFMGDVSYVTLGYTYPVGLMKGGGIGVGYVGSYVPGIITPGQGGFTFSDYNNSAVILASSFAPREDLSVGGAFKFYNQGFSGSTNAEGTGMDLDLGVKWDVDSRMTLAANIQNILPDSMGGRITWANGDYQKIPAITKIGFKTNSDDKKLLLACDMDLQMERNLPALFHAGAEWKAHKNLALRGGLDQNLNVATGGVSTNIALGLGLVMGNVKFDYAFHPYMEETGNLTHYFSISIGGQPPAPKQKTTAEAVKPRVLETKPEKPVVPEVKTEIEVKEPVTTYVTEPKVIIEKKIEPLKPAAVTAPAPAPVKPEAAKPAAVKAPVAAPVKPAVVKPATVKAPVAAPIKPAEVKAPVPVVPEEVKSPEEVKITAPEIILEPKVPTPAVKKDEGPAVKKVLAKKISPKPEVKKQMPLRREEKDKEVPAKLSEVMDRVRDAAVAVAIAAILTLIIGLLYKRRKKEQ